MRKQHSWKTVDADGRKREVRATRSGKRWKLQSKLKGEDHWTYYEEPEREDLKELLDVLQRKYRRGRATADDVESVERLLEKRGGETP